jgi:hypothetical protein
MNLLRAIRKLSGKYVAMSSTCIADVAVHTKMIPHPFLVCLFFIVPRYLIGPKKPSVTDWKIGHGPTRWSGRGQRTHPLLQTFFLFQSALCALPVHSISRGPPSDHPHLLPRPVEGGYCLLVTFSVSFLKVQFSQWMVSRLDPYALGL